MDFYGEELVPSLLMRWEEHNVKSGYYSDMHVMLPDNFGFSNQLDFTDDHSLQQFRDGLNEEA